MKRYALISVYDKTGIVEFAKLLTSLNYSIISTGGTAKALQDSGIKTIPIEKITKNPESFDGRMKTISFQTESGILYDRKNPKHIQEAKKLGILPVDIVICNFYPFEQKQSIENIDVGGPTMVRAAAKNFENVLVVVDPKDYQRIGKALISKKQDRLRKKLAAKAFWYLTYYDSQIANFINKELFPEKITISGTKMYDLRYGENPHQKAALYAQNNSSYLNNLIKHWGRDLSLVNVTDINAGIESVRLFREPCAVVIKHNTPCGIALGDSISQALKRAIEADAESAFGGVVVCNKNFDLKSAKIIAKFKENQGNIDIVSAPQINSNALKLLQSVRKKMGVYSLGKIPSIRSSYYNVKWIDRGFVLQTADKVNKRNFKKWQVVTKIKPALFQVKQMQIAWKFISRIHSNTILVIDKNLPMTRGIGSGQTSRVRATKIALEQAGKNAKGAILASDSFFPFPDSVILAKKYGISAIVQQGGSINDKIVIQKADKFKIPMVFTGRRAFWH